MHSHFRVHPCRRAANDKFEGLSGDKCAQKHIRYEPLRKILEQITAAPCYLAIMVMGICSSFMVKEWKAALEPYDLKFRER